MGSPTRINTCSNSFFLYVLPLGAIFLKHKVSFHCYTDDTQIYFPVRDFFNSNSLDSCLHDVKDWMAANVMKIKQMLLFY